MRGSVNEMWHFAASRPTFISDPDRSTDDQKKRKRLRLRAHRKDRGGGHATRALGPVVVEDESRERRVAGSGHDVVLVGRLKDDVAVRRLDRLSAHSAGDQLLLRSLGGLYVGAPDRGGRLRPRRDEVDLGALF